VAPKRKAPATDDLVRRIMALPRVEKGLYRPCTTPIDAATPPSAMPPLHAS